MKMTEAIPLTVVPIELKEANDFIASHHRHHFPTVGHRFSLGVIDQTGYLHGICVIGRPVARLAGSPRDIVEAPRPTNHGTHNACSMLYAAAARAAKAMGFIKIQTYTLPEEGGASLRASGWNCDGESGGGQWKHSDGKPRRSDQPMGKKLRWSLILNNRDSYVVRINESSQNTTALFDLVDLTHQSSK